MTIKLHEYRQMELPKQAEIPLKKEYSPSLFENSEHSQPSARKLAAPLRSAIMRTRQWLLNQQHPEGYWVGELQGDTILESEYILLLAFLDRHQTEPAKKCANYILTQQLEEGGWTTYPGGSIDVGVSVKAYFALKLTGHDPSCESMDRARRAILAAGGADQVNSFTRFYLALLGQISYDQCPAVPPEAMLMPHWAPINIYKISAWSRTIFVPLSIMWAHKPVQPISAELSIRELFIKPPQQWGKLNSPGINESEKLLSWGRFFRFTDRVMKFLDRHRIRPLRKRSLKKAEQWMLDRFENSDGLGAIFPPIIWSIVALKCLGYDEQSPEVKYNLQQLDDLMIEEKNTIRLQPCKSPVWDTAITLRALADSGLNCDDPQMAKSIDWLLDREVTTTGDWAKRTKSEVGGWFFEHQNEFYPDVDDTIMVIMALREQTAENHKNDEVLPPGLHLVSEGSATDLSEARHKTLTIDKIAGAIKRGLNWTLAMQNRDSGWGAFDKNNDMKILCHVPFADHNAMIDPSTPDLSARVLEMLGCLGKKVGDPIVDKTVKYVRKTQEADGSWFGRWGVNYIYGTWQAIVGLAAVGVATDDPMMVAGVNWLLAYQQQDGGWGESPDSYADSKLKGQGTTTASQTAWAILGLLAAGAHDHPAVARGIRFLLSKQNADGTWDEPEFTGTGFPQVFYLKYHYYCIYFPLMALSRWAQAIGSDLKTADRAAQCLADTAIDEIEI